MAAILKSIVASSLFGVLAALPARGDEPEPVQGPPGDCAGAADAEGPSECLDPKAPPPSPLPPPEPTLMKLPSRPVDAADAQESSGATPVTEEITYLSFTVLRLNPLGLQSQFDLDWKTQLYDPGDSLIKSNNFFSIGVSPIISPALARLGVSAKLQPLAILKLEVRWDYLAWFGNFDLIQSYPDANVDFSDTAIANGGDAGLNYATDGWQLTLDAEARAKVGPVIVRNRFRAAYVEAALKGDDRVFYDQYFDLLLPRSGWFFTNDADLLFQISEKLIVGVRWAFMGVNYTADNFTSSVDRITDSQPMHRLGPLVAYTFHDEPGSGFNRPTILAMVNWHLVHPWRTGQDVSQAFPYIVVGFAFGGRVFP